MLNELRKQLRRDEGEKLTAYQDHMGFWTIGVGRLIDARKNGGISQGESTLLLSNDISDREVALDKEIPWWRGLDDARRGILMNMSFQLGVAGLMKFKTTLEHIRNNRFEAASVSMLESAWATQTPERAKRLSVQLRTGIWQ